MYCKYSFLYILTYKLFFRIITLVLKGIIDKIQQTIVRCAERFQQSNLADN